MDSTPPSAPTRVGRYWLFGPFAHGGMATIHFGRLVGPGGFSRLVALKRLHPLYADEEHYTMLLDEARLSASIRHPNVVQTLDVVHDEQNLCIVMEYVHGVDLATVSVTARRLGERIPPAIATALLAGVLHGLHAAHEVRGEDGRSLGLVHRDVSPQNVVVGADGTARVLDFGIAKALRKNHVTVEGQTKGKIAYIAPEQLVGADVTRQADVYSAGVVLWESLTGRHLFDEPNEAALVSRVLEGQVPPPSQFAPEIGPALDAITLRAVATERRHRFATAQEMAVELEAATTPATNEEVARWLQRVAGGALDALAARMREAESFVPVSPQPTSQRRPPVLLVLAPAGVIVVGAALVIGTMTRHAARAAAAPSAASTNGATAPSTQPAPADVVADDAPSAEDQPADTQVPQRPSAGMRGRPVRSTRAAGCDPPFYFDAKGIKRYKVACVK